VPSLATRHYPASRFEREIADLLGIRAAGHPDPRPLVRHAFWPEDYHPLRRDAGPRTFEDDGRPFPFQQVGGEGVYEIPVGPVHAGIIEPGHFRFSVVGETIIDMKSRLYFTHKGTEKLFEGRAPADGVALAERISGDTSVGHALAYCQAVEAAAGVVVPPRARWLRVVLLELERMYNHVGDFGMIANDTGFAAAHSHCFRIRERLLRLNKRMTGNRLLRGGLVPGGVAVDVPGGVDVAAEVEAALRDFEEIVEISLASTLVADRLDATGRLTRRTALDHGVLGFVARASGIDADARRDHPFAGYAELPPRVSVHESGDVRARTLVRVEEARESARLIRRALQTLPGGPLATAVPPLPPGEPAFALVEGWRGAIIHWVLAGAGGTLARVKVLDPSFLNWPALSYALLTNIVPDFPLCNKSFNQSYSGNDL
jgi:Ni,Fe-hydrogenase III large subunit